MSIAHSTLTSETKTAIADLFHKSSPVLVEVRFPGAATAPDWHLLHDEDEFESLVETLAPNVELSLHSVWDLTNSQSPLCVRK